MISAFTTELRRLRGRGRKMAGPRGHTTLALVVWIIVILVAAPNAQQAPAFSTVSGGAAIPAADAPTEIDLLVGRSTVLNVGATIARVSLTVPDIADALVTAPNQLLIHGKQPGTISLFVWDKVGTIKTYEVKVRRDLTALGLHMKQLFPGEAIEVRGSGKDVVVSGTVSSKYVVEKAGDVAAGYVDKKENVVNLLRQAEGVASNQVMLKVRFAEVSRSALTELGVNFIANGFKNDWFGRTSTQQFSAPDFDSDRAGGLVFSDFLNIFVFNAKEGLGGVVRALQNKGLFQSLAEPNLIASNGKEASFLAGGEYPYPVVQGGTGGSGNAVTIMFKEFGVRLTFTPTVIGNDLVHLKVKPEVSALDFANGVVVSGFRVPALSTRRTETEVELQNGQTFAIAGLMNNTLTNSMSKIPGIGDIPILGLLFQSKAHQKNQTELVVMITPTIIRKGSTGVSEGLPSLVEPYLGAPPKTYQNPTPWVGSPRYPANQPAPRTGGTNDGGAQPQASSAPAATQPATPASKPASQTTAAPAPLASRPIQAPVQQPVATQPPAAAPQTQPAAPAMTREQARAAERAKEDIRRAAAAAEKVSLEQQKRELERAQAEARLADQKKVEDARVAEQRRAEEEQRRAALAALESRQRTAEAEAAAVAKAEQDRKDEEARKLADRLDKERTKREAEVAKKNAETARKRAEEDQKREKALAEAATRLKEAQAAYQAQVDKAKGGSSDKPKSQQH